MWVLVNTTAEIQLLGGVAIRRDARPYRLPLSGVTLEIMAYLLCQGREVRRETLAGQFWEDAEPARARAALNTALWRINKQACQPLGLELASTGETVELSLGGAALDVRELEASVRAAVREGEQAGDLCPDLRARLAAVVDGYGGPFLGGAGGAWAVVQRERLFNLYLRAIGLLMYDCGRRRRYEDALDYGRRLLAADPFHEQAQCQVMWLYVLSGQRVRALMQYRDYEALLRREMAIRPMPETCALFELIRADLPAAEGLPAIGLDEAAAAGRRSGDLVGRLMSVIADSRAGFYQAHQPGA